MQQLARAASGNAASVKQLVKVDADWDQDQDQDQVMGGSGAASRGEADEGKKVLSQQHCQSGSGFASLKDHPVPG